MDAIQKNLTFEESFANFEISDGQITWTEGSSTAGFKEGTVQRLIQKDQPINIKVSWKTSGLLCPFIAGKWRVEVYLEKMGKGEYNGNNIDGSLDYDPNKRNHQLTISVPENTIDKGTYRVVVCLSLLAKDSGQTHGPLAAFADLGIVKVYEESTPST